MLDPVEHGGQESLGGRPVHEQGLERVADARALHLGVVHELDRPVLARALVEEHVHDPGARLDDGTFASSTTARMRLALPRGMSTSTYSRACMR